MRSGLEIGACKGRDTEEIEGIIAVNGLMVIHGEPWISHFESIAIVIHLILQIMTMYQGRTINPAILMEAMDFEGKDIVLEKLKASQQQSIEALQGQLAEAQGQNQMLAEENASMSSAVNEMQMSVGGGQQAQAPLNMQNVNAGVF